MMNKVRRRGEPGPFEALKQPFRMYAENLQVAIDNIGEIDSLYKDSKEELRRAVDIYEVRELGSICTSIMNYVEDEWDGPEFESAFLHLVEYFDDFAIDDLYSEDQLLQLGEDDGLVNEDISDLIFSFKFLRTSCNNILDLTNNYPPGRITLL